MGYAIVATGRFAGLQEILPNEAADETGGLGEVEPRGERNAFGIGYSHSPVTAFWYSFGTVGPKNEEK
jgi:hypothetical protein